jgi:hypothetical protein
LDCPCRKISSGSKLHRAIVKSPQESRPRANVFHTHVDTII